MEQHAHVSKNTGFAQVRYTASTQVSLDSKAPSASTKVDPWALAESDFGDSPFVMATRLEALALPLHLRLREKRLLVHSISPTRYLFPVFGLRYSAARQAIRQDGECHQVPSSPLAPALRWSRGTRPY
ncbi:MAG: hypothetical protein AUH11_07730 [Acidobacteria bacterium 13_2_20CM_57_17]|nr:MAG: hypothetical protein AUH11_07730 [Acidobacteria bacterium 13_2_20CM_57_17]OLB92173.1 MAG: hypothetical protein AUI02_08480 [Acidobacteria bacterium 13_2_20CM_2_57_12]